MKAVIYQKYGPPEVLALSEAEKPVPGDNEILVRIRATTVSVADIRSRSFTVPPAYWLPACLTLGWNGPKRTILGAELAGEVEEVGRGVTRFRPGDAVFAAMLMR